MTKQLEVQKLAVESGYWILYRYDPRRIKKGLNPLQIDSKPPTRPMKDYMMAQNRYRVLQRIDPERAEKLARYAQQDVDFKWNLFQRLAQIDYSWAKQEE